MEKEDLEKLANNRTHWPDSLSDASEVTIQWVFDAKPLNGESPLIQQVSYHGAVQREEHLYTVCCFAIYPVVLRCGYSHNPPFEASTRSLPKHRQKRPFFIVKTPPSHHAATRLPKQCTERRVVSSHRFNGRMAPTLSALPHMGSSLCPKNLVDMHQLETAKRQKYVEVADSERPVSIGKDVWTFGEAKPVFGDAKCAISFPRISSTNRLGSKTTATSRLLFTIRRGPSMRIVRRFSMAWAGMAPSDPYF